MEQKLNNAASRLPEPETQFTAIQEKAEALEIKPGGSTWCSLAAVAACVALLVGIGLGAYALASRPRNPQMPVQLTQGENTAPQEKPLPQMPVPGQAVYRDITTQAYTYFETEAVAKAAASTQNVSGYEISQEQPPFQTGWEGFDAAPKAPEGICYQCANYTRSDETDPSAAKTNDSYLVKYDGLTELWSVGFGEYMIQDYLVVEGGVLAYGTTQSLRLGDPWVAKVNENGNLLWIQTYAHGFQDEYVVELQERPEGGYDLFTRGDYSYFCLTRCAPDGTQLHFQQNGEGDYLVRKIAPFGQGYVALRQDDWGFEQEMIALLSGDGVFTDAYTYGQEGVNFFVTDMMEYGGKLYLSGYVVPKVSGESGRSDVAWVQKQVLDEQLQVEDSEALTEALRENFTAVLLVCDTQSGQVLGFYEAESSLGGKLHCGGDGRLQWDVESVFTSYYYPYVNAYGIAGSCYVFRYTIDAAGMLVQQEKTGEFTMFQR